MSSAYQSGKEWRFNRVAVITGVGRSGTSILAKLIGSMRHTLLLYEPAITKFMLHHPQNDVLTRNILMEDYFIPLILGRNRNPVVLDESWEGNFCWPEQSVKVRRNTRNEAIRYIDAYNPLFIIKTLETQPLISRMRQLFPGCKVIHAVRHGNAIIGSSVNKGWYTDDWLNGSVIDYVVGHTNCKIPWYMPSALREYFSKANQATRIALVWSYLVRLGQRHADLSIRYEDVIEMPDKVIYRLNGFLNVEPTELTETHRRAILRHPETKHPDFTHEIDGAARVYYLKTLNALNYG